MKLSWCALAFGLLGPTAALADGLACQANLLYGDNPTVRDVATGESVTIVPEPYLPRTQVFGSYAFDLGGVTAGGYSPVPATATTYEPAPYTPAPYQPAGGTPSTFLDGTTWTLATLDGRAVTAPATLTFEAGGRYGGRAACNTYGGEVGVFEDFTIDFGGPVATRLACPQLQEEQAYFGILEAVSDFRPGREGDALGLLDANGVTRATFRRDGVSPGQPPAAGSLVGSWTVAGVRVDGRFETDSGFGAPGFEFFDNGRFVANLGCNTAQGEYDQSGDALIFGTVAVTARQCFAPAPFEGPILTNLRNVAMVQASGGGVGLFDTRGVELIRLAR